MRSWVWSSALNSKGKQKPDCWSFLIPELRTLMPKCSLLPTSPWGCYAIFPSLTVNTLLLLCGGVLATAPQRTLFQLWGPWWSGDEGKLMWSYLKDSGGWKASKRAETKCPGRATVRNRQSQRLDISHTHCFRKANDICSFSSPFTNEVGVICGSDGI